MAWEKVGFVGVDAGLLWLGDPCYIIGKKPEELPENFRDWDRFCGSLQERDEHMRRKSNAFGYQGVNLSARAEGASDPMAVLRDHAGLGVAVSTGYGDGMYPVRVLVADAGSWGPRVKAVKVTFF